MSRRITEGPRALPRLSTSYHMDHERADDGTDADQRDTIPAPPPIDLIAESCCCAGMLASGLAHSSDCAEITAVETPGALAIDTGMPRKRSSHNIRVAR